MARETAQRRKSPIDGGGGDARRRPSFVHSTDRCLIERDERLESGTADRRRNVTQIATVAIEGRRRSALQKKSTNTTFAFTHERHRECHREPQTSTKSAASSDAMARPMSAQID